MWIGRLGLSRASLIVVEFRLARIDYHADVVIVVADQVTCVLGNRLIRFIENFILDFHLRILVDRRSGGGGWNRFWRFGRRPTSAPPSCLLHLEYGVAFRTSRRVFLQVVIFCTTI